VPTPQRLPIVNNDDGVWGDIIRQYLAKEHFNDDTDNAANGGHKTITIRPGTAAAGTAPITFSSGTLLSSPEAGAMEFNGDRFYLTGTTGPTRKTIAAYDDSSGATGDIYYRNSGGDFVRLGVGSNGNVLTVAGGLPSWATGFSGTDYVAKAGDTMTGALNLPTDGLTVGTTQLTVADNGTAFAVGIGTATPASATANRTALHIQDTVGNGTELRLNSTSLQARLFNNNSEFGFGTDTSHTVRFFVGGGANTALSLGTDLSATFPGIVLSNSTAAGGSFQARVGGSFALFNTSDVVTNYERLKLYTSTNVYTLASEAAGTGVRRNLLMDMNGTVYSLGTGLGTGGGFAHLMARNATGINLLNITSNALQASSSIQYGVVIDPTMNQSGTAGYTMLYINPTHTAVGSGTKLLANFAVGATSRFSVNSNGATVINTAANETSLDVKSGGQVFKTTQDGGSGQSVFSLARINHASQNNEWYQSISNGGGVLADGSLILSPSTASDVSISGIVGGVSQLVLKSSGRVGVGTNAPSAILDVTGTGSTTVPQIEITPSTSVSGARLLDFATERPWGFAQHATGAGTALELKAYSSDKLFRIKADSSTYNTFVVATSTTSASNSVGIGLDPVAGSGRLQFATGTTAADGILFGGDTNLYRSAPDTLKTDDALEIGSTISASNLSGTNTGDQIISDATITTTDITTNDVSTSKHGFAPKAPNDSTKFLDGTGLWSVPGNLPSSTKTTSYTILGTDVVVLADATSGPLTVTLPAAASFSNYRFYVKRIDTSSNTCTVTRTGGDTIDGQSSVLIDSYTSLMVLSNGTNWFIL
jgi:hypothetical protein